MPSAQISVLDLTARIGVSALEQLGVTGVTGQGLWTDIPLAQVARAPRIDWHRPTSPAGLAAVNPSPAALAILVGPGCLPLLNETLTAARLAGAPTVWFFLLPTALMEQIAISRFMAAQPREGMTKYQLPNSDPQTLWFVLMEQLTKVEQLNDHFLNDGNPATHMTTNLKPSMEAAMTIDGALAVALVDYRSGMCLAQAGGGLNLDLAAAGNTQVVRAKLKTMETLGIRNGIEDILITLANQYHLIRLVPNADGLFLYLVLDRAKGNLALARYKLTDVERSLKV